MENRKYFFVLIFLVMMIAVSAVNAAEDTADIIGSDNSDDFILEDNANGDVFNSVNDEKSVLEDNVNDLALNSVDDEESILDERIHEDADANDEVSLENKNNEIPNSSDDTEKLSEDHGSFIDLYFDVNNNNPEISFSRSYDFNLSPEIAKDGIPIEHNVTIYGNNMVLNGSGQSRIFRLPNDDIKVTLHDITFADACTDASGGAIFGAGFTVINCTFINNFASDSLNGKGGAMYLGTAINCTFISNRAGYSGGALYNSNAINCSFYENYAETYGGAVYSDSESTVENSTFESNHADLGGGAIYNCTAMNCTFKNNFATLDAGCYGGAMYNGEAINCYFENNSAVSGGAIYQGNATNSSFNANKGQFGGAIYQGNALNCAFADNEATEQAKSMYGGTAILCRFASGQVSEGTEIISAALSVSDFNFTYGSGEKLLFNLIAGGVNYNGFNTTIDIYQGLEKISTLYALTGDGLDIDLAPGIYNATLSLPDYDIQPVQINLKVISPTSILVKDLNTTHNSGVDLIATLLDYNLKPIIGVNLTVELNGNSVDYLTDGKGQIKIPTNDLALNKYEVKINYIGNETYVNSNANVNLTIQKGITEIIANNVSTTYNIYKDLVITLKDQFGNPIRGVSVSVDLNGISNYFTDGNGQIKISTEGLAIANYPVTIDFEGNEYFEGKTASATVNIAELGDFTLLNNTIASFEGNYLKLETNFIFNNIKDSIFSSGILIDKNNLVIDGQGNLIDGMDLARIFNIVGNNVTLLNINFIHGKTAINWTGSNGTVDGCNFSNNSAELGGAIYWSGENGVVNNSVFKDNKAESYNHIYAVGNTFSLANSTLESNLTINQIEDCPVFSNRTINFSFDDGTNFGDYSVVLFNRGIEITRFNLGDTYQYTFENLAEGNYLITVNASDNKGNAFKSSNFMEFYVYKYNSSVTINSIKNITYGEKLIVDLMVENKTAVNFDVYRGDGTKVRFGIVSSNELIIDQLSAGNYTIVITNVENDTCYESNASKNFTVDKLASSIEILPISNVHLYENFIVNLVINNKNNLSFEIKDSNGIVLQNGTLDANNITCEGLGLGNYIISVKNAESDNYYGNSVSRNFRVSKFPSSVAIKPIKSVYYGNPVIVGFTVNNRNVLSFEIRDLSGKLVRNGYIDSSNLILQDLSAGNYKITILNKENMTHYGSSASSAFSVNKYNVDIVASKVTSVYNVGKYLKATIKGANGEALAKAKVSLKINGKTKTLTTDSKGQVKFVINGLAPKTYVASIAFGGNDKFNPARKSVKVIVKKANLKLSSVSKTYKLKFKKKKFIVYLRSNKNKLMKNVKLTLKVNGKTYKAKTNKNGKAIFKLNKLYKTGKFTGIVKFSGNKYYNKFSKKVKIAVKK